MRSQDSASSEAPAEGDASTAAIAGTAVEGPTGMPPARTESCASSWASVRLLRSRGLPPRRRPSGWVLASTTARTPRIGADLGTALAMAARHRGRRSSAPRSVQDDLGDYALLVPPTRTRRACSSLTDPPLIVRAAGGRLTTQWDNIPTPRSRRRRPLARDEPRPSGLAGEGPVADDGPGADRSAGKPG